MSLMNQLVGMCLYTNVHMCAQLIQLADATHTVVEYLTQKFIDRPLKLVEMRSLIYRDDHVFV